MQQQRDCHVDKSGSLDCLKPNQLFRNKKMTNDQMAREYYAKMQSMTKAGGLVIMGLPNGGHTLGGPDISFRKAVRNGRKARNKTARKARRRNRRQS